MKAFQTMKSMELDDDEKMDVAMPIKTDQPDYPWGLRICLSDKELPKLGIDAKDAVIGGMLHGHFIASVTSNRQNGDCSRIELQITHMEIESEDAENKEEEKAEPKPRSKLRSIYR